MCLCTCVCARDILQGCLNIVSGSLYILRQATTLRQEVLCRRLRAWPGTHCSPLPAAQIPALSVTGASGVSFPGTPRLLAGQLRGKGAWGCKHWQKVSLCTLPCTGGFCISSQAILARRGMQEQVPLHPYGTGNTVGLYSCVVTRWLLLTRISTSVQTICPIH